MYPQLQKDHGLFYKESQRLCDFKARDNSSFFFIKSQINLKYISAK